MTRSVIGDRPKRREDVRFLTGRGSYLDDLAFERLTHAVVLRSPHAHAVIEDIRTDRAQGCIPKRRGQCRACSPC